MSDLKLAIILGSTRPGRNGKAVADWVLTQAKERTSADYELIDLIDYPLPHLDEPVPPSRGRYAGEHTKAWAATISEFDGYLFITPEYNHSTSAVLKNAIDYLYAEWNNKAAEAWKRQDPQLTEREAIAFRNWERLVAGIRR